RVRAMWSTRAPKAWALSACEASWARTETIMNTAIPSASSAPVVAEAPGPLRPGYRITASTRTVTSVPGLTWMGGSGPRRSVGLFMVLLLRVRAVAVRARARISGAPARTLRVAAGAYDGVMSRIAITAFSGWNDAGEAASGVIEHLLQVWPSRPVGAVDAEEFIDFQVNRPEIRTTEEGLRVVDWPDTRLHLITPPRGPEIVAVIGPEPSLRWKRFCDEVLEQLQALDVSSVVSLGALLADSPHSRPLP